ncbi:MAG: hypothetical protein QM762_09510 [Chryseolinea sp.]
MKTRLSCISILLLLAAISCNEHETPIEQYGHLSLRITGLSSQAGDNAEYPSLTLLLSLETKNGQLIYDQERLNLTPTGQEAVIEQAILLPVDDYKITKFVLILNDKAVYALPREGSAKATSGENVVPIRFGITAGNQKQLTHEVLPIHENDQPEDFGYDTFGADEQPGNTDWMDIRVKFEPTIGKIFYENTDAEFFITAYDASNNEKWRAKLPYTGPQANDLKIRTGYDHYVFEVEKWKVKSRQEFKGTYLWERRIQDGAVPTTFVFAGSAAVKRLSYIINYTRSNGGLTTDTKTSYQYNNDGSIASIVQYQYASASNSFVLSGNSKFTYQSGRVSKIESFGPNLNTPGEVITYTYDDQNRPTQIQHRSSATALTTDVALQYSFGGRVVNTVYRSSNGQQFEYSFVNDMGSIKTDKTTRGASLCSEGAYNYDKGINPLSHLGYVDFLLRNFSINNRITEQVEYTGCSFPSYIPEFTDYNYDGDGYPTQATKHYKESDLESITRFFYQ